MSIWFIMGLASVPFLLGVWFTWDSVRHKLTAPESNGLAVQLFGLAYSTAIFLSLMQWQNGRSQMSRAFRAWMDNHLLLALFAIASAALVPTALTIYFLKKPFRELNARMNGKHAKPRGFPVKPAPKPVKPL